MEEKEFLQLVSQNQAMIHKICQLYRDTPEDRQDIFQEIVFQLWRSIDSFKGESKPSTFLYRIAINTAITSFKRDKARTLVHFTDQLPDIPQEEGSSELVARTDALTTALKALQETDRAIIALVLEEVSYREIAEIIGTSENNVAVKVNRIKARLRKLLTP